MNAVVLAHGVSLGGRDGARAKLTEFWSEISRVGEIYSPVRTQPWEKWLQAYGFQTELSPAYMAFQAMTHLFSPYQLNPFDINPLKDVLTAVVDFESLARCPRATRIFLTATNVRSGTMRMPPAAVVQILTSFHARVIPIVRANNGVIDKFLGDGVMATFGAAEVSQTAAADALRALEQILQAAAGWQDGLPGRGIDVVLKVNASVAAGRVVFATLGFGDRLEYTVIGDAVNLAAKLEKHNKTEKSLAVVPRQTVDRALEQGYRPVIYFVLRKQAQISGVDVPMDLNVCVDLPPHAAIAAGY